MLCNDLVETHFDLAVFIQFRNHWDFFSIVNVLTISQFSSACCTVKVGFTDFCVSVC